MGCAAVRGGETKQPTVNETVSNPPVVASTWATKTSEDPKSGSTTPVTQASPSGSSPKRKDGNLVMQDADDDEEIEIIYETSPKKQKDPPIERGLANGLANPAANGQEPPEAVEVEKKIEKQPEPLSKSQQEEAAKLAERRKKFDNDRYQRDQQEKPAELVFNRPKDAYVSPAPAAKQTHANSPQPAAGMMFGLNEAPKAKDQNSQQNRFTDIPGGIIDDEDVPVPTKAGGKKKKSHDDIDSNGFDADDEKMMAEILEDFDDF